MTPLKTADGGLAQHSPEQGRRGCGGPVISGDLSLKNLIKKIGKGPKLAKDLTREEARSAMTQILSGQAQPQQIGAFLIAGRIKSETAEETAGFVEATRGFSKTLSHSYPKLLELASAHDGKNKNLLLSPFVGLILSKAGIPVVLTGGKDVPTKKGVTARHIFEVLQWQKNFDAKEVEICLKEKKPAYWDISHYCPALESLKSLRDSLGLRTALNTVEKLINPANATHLCTGVFHGPYLKEVAEAMRMLNQPHLLCVQATEGSTDLPLKKRVLCRSVHSGILSEQEEIDPEKFGMKREANPVFLGENCLLPGVEEEDDNLQTDVLALAKINIQKVHDALMMRDGLIYDALIYNAGVQLWFCEEVKTIEDGIKKVREILATDVIIKSFK